MNPDELSDADLWEKLVDAGLSEAEATRHVQLRAQFSPAANEAASVQDQAADAPGPLASGIVGFGHGASLGLAGDPEYLRQARKANPKSTIAGDILGAGAVTGLAAPLVAGLSPGAAGAVLGGDRKSTRLNSSHVEISYAVFCLKKKKEQTD